MLKTEIVTLEQGTVSPKQRSHTSSFRSTNHEQNNQHNNNIYVDFSSDDEEMEPAGDFSATVSTPARRQGDNHLSNSNKNHHPESGAGVGSERSEQKTSDSMADLAQVEVDRQVRGKVFYHRPNQEIHQVTLGLESHAKVSDMHPP